MVWTRNALLAAVMVPLATGTANAGINITEWMYSGTDGEYVELTNVGPGAVDTTGWSYDDVDAVPGSEDIGVGVLAVGESMILTESDAATFRTQWALPASVKVVGGITNNLGRGDEINVFDDNDLLVDRLTYGDQVYAGTIRTQNVSGVPMSPAALGANDVYQWKFSILFDEYGTYTSLGGDRGNPGFYANIVPEPGSIVLAVLGLVGLLGTRRRS
jgi:predicted extracellular nuclease